MGIRDLKFITFLSGVIGLLLGLFTFTATVVLGAEGTWRLYLALIVNVGQVIGSIAVFFISAKITVWSQKRISIIFILLVFCCLANDIIYLTLINTFPGVVFIVVALLIYRHKKGMVAQQGVNG